MNKLAGERRSRRRDLADVIPPRRRMVVEAVAVIGNTQSRQQLHQPLNDVAMPKRVQIPPTTRISLPSTTRE